MKKKLSILTFTILAQISAFAQIQITQEDVSQAGHTYVSRSIDTTFADAQLSKKGADQTWDYSALKGGGLGSTAYKTPTSADQKVFPNATLVEVGDDSSKAFYSVSSSNVLFLGFQDSIANKFNPPLLYAKLPVVYGNKDQSISKIIYKEKNPGTINLLTSKDADSIRVTVTFYKYDTIDTWGTIKTPYATHDALEVITHVKTTTTFEAHIVKGSRYEVFGIGWKDGTDLAPSQYTTPTHTREFNWWAKGVGAPVFSIESDDSTGVKVNSVSWFTNDVAATTSPISQNAIMIAPNPVSASAQVLITENGSYSYNLANITGTTIQSGTMNQGINALQFTGMNGGLYMLKITDEAGRTLVKKIEVQK